MGSWVRTITSPFRKACTLINPPRQKNPQPGEVCLLSCLVSLLSCSDCAVAWTNKGHAYLVAEAHDRHRMALHGEVMACSYHDVQVMWSILDKSNPGEHDRR